MLCPLCITFFFFFNDTATTEIYTLSLHDALPISRMGGFDGTIVMGIWDPWSDEEWSNAVKQRRFVDGYCVGNEGLGVRYRPEDRKSTRLNSSHLVISYAVFCLKKKKENESAHAVV